MAKITALSRTHRRLAEVAVAVIALGAGVGIGFGLTGLGGSSSPVVAATPTPPTTVPATTSTGPGAPKLQGVRGQITAENGSTWTVLSRAGQTVTVVITPSTRFGTRADPAPETQFVTGSQIGAVGARTGTTLTATRVVVPANATPPSTSTPSTAVPSNATA